MAKSWVPGNPGSYISGKKKSPEKQANNLEINLCKYQINVKAVWNYSVDALRHNRKTKLMHDMFWRHLLNQKTWPHVNIIYSKHHSAAAGRDSLNKLCLFSLHIIKNTNKLECGEEKSQTHYNTRNIPSICQLLSRGLLLSEFDDLVSLSA